ncbi:MAG TPA: M56 family metallopeptidase [Vicinamibacterales bacterium]|jgi:TonB family protein|nr:M56 family metallopeptidase [Vicinamibacterales bacterium]
MSIWMIESALAVSVIVLVGLVASVALGRQSAALRHWVLAVAVACAWASPAARMVLPSWASVPLWQTTDDTARRAGSPRNRATPPVTVTTEASAVPASFAVAPKPRLSVVSLHRQDVVWAVWIVGTLFSAFTLLIGVTRLRWLASSADTIDSGPWYDVAEDVRADYGLSSPIRLLQSDHPSLLIAWGWRRPTVLLPLPARTWSRDRIEVVLAHELAHLVRLDSLWQLAVAGLCAVYWFNPLLRIASARLRAESEHACDDAVLNRGIEGSAYATHLLVLARTLHRQLGEFALPAMAMARPSHLEGRVRAMLNSDLNRRRVSWKARVGTVVVLMALTLSVAGLRGQSSYYRLSGTVLDPTGRVLPAATLVLTSATTGAKYEVQSDAAGRFEFVGLPQGTYTLKTSLPGFAPLTWENIRVAGDIEQNLQLRVGSLQETITVTGGSVPVAQPDAAAVQRREEARRRSAERVQQALARCAAGAATFPVGGNILPPAKLVDVKPIYPEQVKASGVSGIVTMDAVIGTNGLVRDVQNVSGPHPDLEAAAANAVREWEFSPTLLNCEAIEVNMRVTVNFAASPVR